MLDRPLAALPITLLSALPASADVFHVDADLTTGANDGSSWADAFQGPDGLQAALAVTQSGDQVFVAQGTYRPSATGDRTESFRFQTGVEIYGSFVGGEASPSERPRPNRPTSILSGDLNGDDGAGMIADNSFHILKGGTSNLSGVLDRFLITGGNANGVFPNDQNGSGFYTINNRQTLRDCHFVTNRSVGFGGAAYVYGSGPRFTGCVFEDNYAARGGAAYVLSAYAPRFDRCVFVDNLAYAGGALDIHHSQEDVEVTSSLFHRNTSIGSGAAAIESRLSDNTTVANCTIVGNEARTSAYSGVRGLYSVVRIDNSIVWGHSGTAIESAVVSHSLVEGGYAGTGNLSEAPLFVDAASGDYRLRTASPGIDAGDNSVVPAHALRDLARNLRFDDEPDVADTGSGIAPIVDMGAYESSLAGASNYCTVTPNSAGPGAVMGSAGSASVSGNGFSLSTTGVVPAAFGLYFYGPTQLEAPFGDGVRCAGGPATFRVYPLEQATAAGNVVRALDFGAPPASAGPGAISPGSTWNFQLWFRDGPAGGAGFNTSDGLRVTFAP